MKTADVMTQEVISVAPTADISEALSLMLRNRISGLPVINSDRKLVGMISEGDFLRRGEISTLKRHPRWIEFLLNPNALAADYKHAHSRKVADVMTSVVVSVEENTPLVEAVRLMETKHVKRLPVMRGERVIGIISRADLLHALAALQPNGEAEASDAEIREQIVGEIQQKLSTLGSCSVVVRNGVVDLWGTVYADREAFAIAASNARGVKEVRNHLVWIEPISGTVIEPLIE